MEPFFNADRQAACSPGAFRWCRARSAGRLVGPSLVAAVLVLLSTAASAQVEPVRVIDVGAFFNACYGSSSTIASRRLVHDRLAALASLMGLVNRDSPRLYSIFQRDIDELWLARLADPKNGGGLIAGRPVMRLNTAVPDNASTTVMANSFDPAFDAALDAYGSVVKGLAVWDENVPSSFNGAFAAAGADDLIVVRWDASPNSLYQKLRARGLTEKVWLVQPDGGALFVNNPPGGKVPGLGAGAPNSTGRAKTDVYLWANEKYQKANKLDPTEFGLMTDGSWIRDPRYARNGGASPLTLWYVPNHDYQVAHRGLPFDLSPWDDLPADDDPGAPAGVDAATQRVLLLTARSKTSNRVITLRGFVPWPYKYSVPGATDFHRDIEWYSVKLVSGFGAGLDADAYSPTPQMSNASFYQHASIDPVPDPQVRPTPEDLNGMGFLSGLGSNGGFEDNGAGWTLSLSNAVVYADPTHSRDGLSFLECNTADTSNNAKNNLYQDGPGVGVGQTITLRSYVRASAPMQVEQVIWALGGTQEKAVTVATIGTAWTEVRTRLTVAQAGHTQTRAQIYLRTPNVNLDVDDVAFYAGDAAAGSVVPANYVLWLLGDHDSSAWLYNVTPNTWDAPGRGIIPVAWDFSGHMASRFPPHYSRVLATRTRRDFFISGDSGPGYGQPSQMNAAMRAVWAAEGVRDARVLDTSIGWVLDPVDALTASHFDAVTPYNGDGVLVGPYLISGGDTGLIDNTPVIRLKTMDSPPSPTPVPFGELAPADLAWGVLNRTSPTLTPQFSAFRIVALKNLAKFAADASQLLASQHANYRYRFVDPFAFFALARKTMGGSNTYRASYTAVNLPTTVPTGPATTLRFKVRNDGWETWNATGPNPIRAGVSLVNAAASTLPAPAYNGRINLPQDVSPGEEVTLSYTLPSFSTAGPKTFQVDMVREGVAWFSAQNDISLLLPFDVVAPGAPDAGAGGGGGTAGGAGGSGGAGGNAGGTGGTGGGSAVGGGGGSPGGGGGSAAGGGDGGGALLTDAGTGGSGGAAAGGGGGGAPSTGGCHCDNASGVFAPALLALLIRRRRLREA